MLYIGEKEVFVTSTYPNIMPGRYKVSNYGRIYNTKTCKIKKLTPHSDGYVSGKFKMCDGKNKIIAIHRLVAWEFCTGYDESNGRIFVNHIDYIKDNNRAYNLEWCTRSENERHKREKYDLPNPPTYYGKEHPASTHDEKTIHKICKYLRDGYSIIGVMNKFGYKCQNDNKKFYNLIYDIKRKKCWVTISKKYNI